MKVAAVQRWIAPSALALALLATACSGGGGSAAADPTRSSTTVASTAAPSTTVVDTTTTEAATTTEAPTTTVSPQPTADPRPLTSTLKQGAKGDEVAMVQQRLHDIGIDPGDVDGKFGSDLTEAVWAFQSLSGVKSDGIVTPQLWSMMQQTFAPAALQPDGPPDRLEVDLPRQVLMLYQSGQLTLVSHISTGSGVHYCEKGICSQAITPGGVYQFGYRIKGWFESTLGKLYNPVFFNQGIAVHGALSVPNHPASHGCVRIPMHIAEYFPKLVTKGEKVFVFDGQKSPLEYGAQPPPPNVKDPNYVPPSSTTVPGETTIPSVTNPDDTLPSVTQPVPTTGSAPNTVPTATVAPPPTSGG